MPYLTISITIINLLRFSCLKLRFLKMVAISHKFATIFMSKTTIFEKKWTFCYDFLTIKLRFLGKCTATIFFSKAWPVCPRAEIKVICNLYWSQTAKVRVGDSYTSQFQVKKGVRQGCILSPVLFNIYSEELINEALSQFKGATFNGVSYTNIRFADDTMVVAESEEELQKMIESV